MLCTSHISHIPCNQICRDCLNSAFYSHIHILIIQNVCIDLRYWILATYSFYDCFYDIILTHAKFHITYLNFAIC